MSSRRYPLQGRCFGFGSSKLIPVLWLCLLWARPDSAFADSLSNVYVYVNEFVGLVIEAPNGSGANTGGTVTYNSNLAVNGAGIGSTVNIYPGAGTTYRSPTALGLTAATVQASTSAPQYGDSYNGQIFAASATATGNLATGSVTTSSGAGLPCIANQCDYGLTSVAAAQIYDTLTFHIAGASNSTVTNIGIQFTIHGSSNPGVPTQPGVLSASAAMTGSMELGSGGITYNFDTTPGYPAVGRILQNGGWGSSTIVSQTPQNFIFNGTYALTGSTVSVPVRIALQCNTSGGSCSYTDTAAISLNLPSNVSFTSDSGVFLTAPTQPPAIAPNGVVSASAFGEFKAAAPGSWIEIYGSNLAAQTLEWSTSDFNGANAPTSLEGTSVLIGGQPAYVSYVSNGQVNAQVPNLPAGPQPLVVSTAAGSNQAYTITINQTEPGLLAPSQFQIGGKQYVGALFPDAVTFVLPSGAAAGVPSRPAKPGDTITIYGVGFGPVAPDTPPGQLVPGVNQLTTPLEIQIGGVAAPLEYSGLAPDEVGLYQFNVTVPNVASGDAIPLTFTLGGVSSSQTLYIAIQQP